MLEDSDRHENKESKAKIKALVAEAAELDHQVQRILDAMAHVTARIRAAQRPLELQSSEREQEAMALVLDAASHVASCDRAIRSSKSSTALALEEAERCWALVQGDCVEDTLVELVAAAEAAAEKAEAIAIIAQSVKVGDCARQVASLSAKLHAKHPELSTEREKAEKLAMLATQISLKVISPNNYTRNPL